MARNSEKGSKLLALIENLPGNILLLGMAGLVALGVKTLYNTNSSLDKMPVQLKYTINALNQSINPPTTSPETYVSKMKEREENNYVAHNRK